MSTSLQVSPDYFAADRLCDCSPGWIPSCSKVEGRCSYPNFREFRQNPNGVVARTELDCCKWTSIVSIVEKGQFDVHLRCFAALKCPGTARVPNARSAQWIPSAMSIHLGNYAIHALLAANRQKALPRGAAASVKLEFWTIRVGALPCFSLVNLGIKCMFGHVFPQKLFEFSRVVKLWSSVQKSCVEAELLTIGTKSGSADVQRTKPSPRTPAWNATTCSWTARNQEPKSTRPVPCQITLAWATRAAHTSAWRQQADVMPTSPTLWAKSRGYPIWRVFCQYIDVSMFWYFGYFMDSLEHLQYVLLILNDTCDLWYLVLVGLEANQDPGGAGCAAGYAAPMCIQCNHGYFSHGQQCERCRTSNVVSSAVVVAAAILVLAGLGAAFIWHRRNTEGHPTNPSCRTALVQQAKAQVPMLLQLCGLAIAINLMEHMPWREWNEHMFYAAIEIGLFCFNELYCIL